MDRAEIRDLRDGGDDFSFKVGTASGGVPTNTVLASTTVPDTSVADNPAFTLITACFASPAGVVAGQSYGLVTTRGAEYWFTTESTGSCPGRAFVDSGSGGGQPRWLGLTTPSTRSSSSDRLANLSASCPSTPTSTRFEEGRKVRLFARVKRRRTRRAALAFASAERNGTVD